MPAARSNMGLRGRFSLRPLTPIRVACNSPIRPCARRGEHSIFCRSQCRACASWRACPVVALPHAVPSRPRSASRVSRRLSATRRTIGQPASAPRSRCRLLHNLPCPARFPVQSPPGPCSRSRICTSATSPRATCFGARPKSAPFAGESGSGKSTLAKLLLGLEPPSAGRIVLDGEDVTDCSAHARQVRIATVQMAFQDPQSALNPRRRVASIVTQAMEAGRQPAAWDERIKRAKALLSEMGLSAELAMRYPAQLSGGQRQRINVARALCKVPKILVADEIVSGLDVSIQAQLLQLLVRLRDEFQFAMLFISHDLSVVRHLCSRVLVMYRGEIVEQGPTEAIFAQPQHAHTRALLSAVPAEY